MISIVVPCYNCEKTFEKCINSIRNQSYQQIEIILVDDGSTDSTGILCEEVAKEDGRIKVIHQKNGGLMNAWKNGVRNATKEYIAFCDSDDYVDLDLAETMMNKISESNADIILYGMNVEYADGVVETADNQLERGLYPKEDIAKLILPNYFDNGQMQSEMILASRDTKIFRRKLLLKVIECLSDEISLGEDELTTFAAVLSAQSIYCMCHYYPYHYMRNNESMIGKYDSQMFHKYLLLRKQLIEIARIYGYPYLDQIEKRFVSHTLLCMKKEIGRNRGSGYKEVKCNLISMRDNAIFQNALKVIEVKNYRGKSRVFLKLVIGKKYFMLYVITNFVSQLGIGKP